MTRGFTPANGRALGVANRAITQSVIPDSVIHRWGFEDDADTTVAVDSVGAADGTISGSTYDSTTVQVGSLSLAFDGTDDRVELPDLGLGSTSAFSVVLWQYLNSLGSSNQTLFGRYDGTDDIFDLGVDDTGWSCRMGHVGGNEITGSDLNIGSPSTGVWTMVTAAWDGVDTLSVYIDDGATSKTVTKNIDDFATGNGPWIGARTDSNAWVDGNEDHVEVYNEYLTESQVSDIYAERT